MNYYRARQVQDGPHAGAWHYTCQNGDGIYPVGHCSSIKPCPDCNADGHHVGRPFENRPPDCQTCGGRCWVAKSDAERCWHATAAEAMEHYRDYLADRARFAPDLAEGDPRRDTLHRCQAPGCTEFTTGFASPPGGWNTYWLCGAHRTREVLRGLLEVGESISST